MVRRSNAQASADLDRTDLDSSPDPLAGPVNAHYAVSRKTTRRSSSALVSSSPSKQNRRAATTEIDVGSPSKSMVLSTPRAHGASPWRIKVTVQAEPDCNDENAHSPTQEHVLKSRTTIVPLKDADNSSPTKRRGRPRRTDDPKPKGRKTGTPARARSKSTSRRSSVGVDHSTTDIGAEVPAQRKRGRPRKIVQPVAKENPTSIVQNEPTSHPTTPGESVTIDQAQDLALDEPTEAPLTTEPEALSITATQASPYEQNTNRSAGSATRDLQPINLLTAHSDTLPLEYTKALVFTPPQSEMAQKLRARRGTPASKQSMSQPDASTVVSDEDDKTRTPSASEDEDSEDLELVTAEHGSTHTNLVADANSGRVNEEEDLQDVTYFALDEGLTRYPNDTTMLESENFSIISVDSLPSSAAFTSPVSAPSTNLPKVSNTIENVLDIPTSTEKQHIEDESVRETDDRDIACITRSEQVIVSPRQMTPAVDDKLLDQPPPLNVARVDSEEVETPKIGRVVKAGVALQGVLEPTCSTPKVTAVRTPWTERHGLDDLFRGFSDGTRKQLHDGLKLGEHLAQRTAPTHSSAGRDSLISASVSESATACGEQQHLFRLPTPEDHSDNPEKPHASQNSDAVQYPVLQENKPTQLLSPNSSPSQSEGMMSWRIDTPPVRTLNPGPLSDTTNAMYEAKREGAHDATDIWQEDGSRSSYERNPDATHQPPQILEISAQEGASKPARGKLPRTWRRKSSDNFRYSDEADSPERMTPVAEHDATATGADPLSLTAHQPVEAPDTLLEDHEDAPSEASDDTGMFFTTNLPNVYTRKRQSKTEDPAIEHRDLSLFRPDGQSLLPPSSPPAPIVPTVTSETERNELYLHTPPRLPTFRTSPVKSSPLRNECHTSDFSSDSIRQGFEESTLPVALSSPFHTQVEDVSMHDVSSASDQRQFKEELVGSMDSSLRRIQIEADEYLDAYERQERSLNGIDEVTEPSRSLLKSAIPPSSPEGVRQMFQESMFNPKRTYAPLFGSEPNEARTLSVKTAHTSRLTPDTPPTSSPEEIKTTIPASRSGGVLSQLTTTFWSAVSKPTSSSSSNHPILSTFYPLPKVEPWTKTHYKSLDRLYQVHKKDKTLFAPSSWPSSQTATNDDLLSTFQSDTTQSFLGARYSVWGYDVSIDERFIILCAVYMQLLTLENAEEYERTAQKKIEVGDCAPGQAGELIGKDEVVRRLATVIMGEKLRRDERKGKVINRNGAMSVQWPVV